ncbi:ANK1 [Symbiodinium microadriaticum]|nr:ANK1 [Symbiodinium microadriaticum]
MIRVFMASGEELIAAPVEELSDVRTLKTRLAGLCSVPRFRQKLLLSDGTSLADWSTLDQPMDLQLVLLPFGYASSEQAQELIDMASLGRDSEVEEMMNDCLHPDVAYNGGETALFVASRKGLVSTVKLLLEANAVPDRVSRSNRLGPALHVACFAGHAGVTQLLLEARAEVGKVPGRAELPLNLACFKGSAETVQHLLDAKADKDAKGQQGFTPLLEACSRGNVSVVRLLLESRANVDTVCCSDDVSHGETPLYVAARSGYVEVVRLLLQAGADTEKICGMQGLTALDMARRKSRMQTSQMHVVYALRPQSDVWQESIQSVSLEQAELDRLMREKMSSKPRPTQKQRVKEAITWLLEAGADLEVLCADGNSEVRSGAAALLAELGPENGGSRAVALLQSSDAQARATAAEAIGRLGREAASHAEAVVALLGDPETTVRMAAVAAIGKLGGGEVPRHESTVSEGGQDEELLFVEILVQKLFDGELGVVLEGLEITWFDVDEAADAGWQIFDQIVAVDGRHVSTNEEFNTILARLQLPIVFKVKRRRIPVQDIPKETPSAADCDPSTSRSRKQSDEESVDSDDSARNWWLGYNRQLLEQKHQLLEIIRKGFGVSRAFSSAPEMLRADKELVLAAVRRDGDVFGLASKELQRDREVVLAAVRQRGDVLERLDTYLRCDKEVILEAVLGNPDALQYMSLDRGLLLHFVASTKCWWLPRFAQDFKELDEDVDFQKQCKAAAGTGLIFTYYHSMTCFLKMRMKFPTAGASVPGGQAYDKVMEMLRNPGMHGSTATVWFDEEPVFGHCADAGAWVHPSIDCGRDEVPVPPPDSRDAKWFSTVDSRSISFEPKTGEIYKCWCCHWLREVRRHHAMGEVICCSVSNIFDKDWVDRYGAGSSELSDTDAEKHGLPKETFRNGRPEHWGEGKIDIARVDEFDRRAPVHPRTEKPLGVGCRWERQALDGMEFPVYAFFMP